MRSHVLVVLLVSAALAGCIGPDTEEATLDPAATDAPVLVMDLPIHVVAVGFDTFDGEGLLEHMEPALPSLNWGRSTITGGVDPEPLQYDIEYVIHTAPEAFAEALFAYAASIATPGPADGFLEDYDREGQHRICAQDESPLTPLGEVPTSGEDCDDVQRIDAVALETWIAENRAGHGLSFPGPGYTVFVLDHHTREHLPRDTYHQYTIDDGPGLFSQDNLRAWGGNHDLVFLDVSAGPNRWDLRSTSIAGRDGWEPRGGADLPVWDLVDDVDVFYENLARNLRDATSMLWARGPVYALDHADRYVVPFRIFIDPNARTNPESPLHGIDPVDIPANTDEEGIAQAFRELVPWAEVQVEFDYVHLPDDDPDMHAVLQDAKNRHWASFVDYGIVKRHLNENWDHYVPDQPDARVHPAFVFWTEFPSPFLYGYGDNDEWGDPWGVIMEAGDASLCARPDVPVCTSAEVQGWTDAEFWDYWNGLLIHEMGHSFGLHHPFMAGGLDEDDYDTLESNWLWDSTATAMAYRSSSLQFSSFDKEFLLRHHAVHVAADVLRDASAPAAAREAASTALELVEAGRYAQALDEARKGRAATGDHGVLQPPGVGATVRGDTVTTVVEIPAGDSVGLPSTGLPLPWSVPLPTGDLSRATFPVDVPDGAVAIEIEYREQDAPSHAKWAAWAAVVNEEADPVANLWYNAHDKVVLRALDRCDRGCTGSVYGYGGAAMTYEVGLTPLFPTGSEAPT